MATRRQRMCKHKRQPTISYAQCWEDADVVLEALAVRPGDTCWSIASGGDNTLALLTQDPKRVVAVDVNRAQIACLELRVAAYRELDHPGLLELIGSRPSARRMELYRSCRPALSSWARWFWDARPRDIRAGIGSAGTLERYFAMFRRAVLPLAHSRRQVASLLCSRSRMARQRYYDETWNTWRWRLLFRTFFSAGVMRRLGRDPDKFKYATTAPTGPIVRRALRAITELDPSDNPYLQWILTGRHTTALPCALRSENFETIRSRLDRLEWHCRPLEAHLSAAARHSVDRFNLSDIFEYMPVQHYRRMLDQIIRVSTVGGRAAYWNMYVPRHRPRRLRGQLRALRRCARRLHQRARTFFYRDFVVEEVRST